MALTYDYLLLEDGSFLLQEIGDKIIIDSYEAATGSGTIAVSGTASEQMGLSYNALGGIAVRGVSNLELGLSYNALGGIIISGTAILTLTITQHVGFTEPTAEEEPSNYDAAVVEPDQVYAELLGGKYESVASGKREAESPTVSRIDFASKDKVKGVLRSEPQLVSRIDFASKDKIRGVPNTETGRVLRENFTSKKKVKGKRTGRDGTLSYEDDMFKR